MDTPEGKKSFIKPWGSSAVSIANRRNRNVEDSTYNGERRRENIGICEGLGLSLTSLPYLLKRNDYESSPYSYLIKMNKELSAFRRV